MRTPIYGGHTSAVELREPFWADVEPTCNGVTWSGIFKNEHFPSTLLYKEGEENSKTGKNKIFKKINLLCCPKTFFFPPSDFFFVRSLSHFPNVELVMQINKS